MFESPEITLGSAGVGFGPGVNRVVAELRARPGHGPPRIEVALPPDELDADLDERIGVTLRAYCAERRRLAACERQATMRSGVRSFLLGVPVAAIGLAMSTFAVRLGDVDKALRIAVGTLGLVLTWVGLWYPFDKILFYPYDAMRDEQALRQLQKATVATTAFGEMPPPGPVRS
jgi:hypothetical protein